MAWLGLADSISATSAIAPRARSQPRRAALLVASALSTSRERSSSIRPPRILRSASSRASATATSARAASAAALQHLVAVDQHRVLPPSPESASSSRTTPTICPPASIERSSAIGSGALASVSATRAFAYSARPLSSPPPGARAASPRGRQDDGHRAAGLRRGQLGDTLQSLAVEDGLDHAGAELAHGHSSAAAPAATSSSEWARGSERMGSNA